MVLKTGRWRFIGLFMKFARISLNTHELPSHIRRVGQAATFPSFVAPGRRWRISHLSPLPFSSGATCKRFPLLPLGVSHSVFITRSKHQPEWQLFSSFLTQSNACKHWQLNKKKNSSHHKHFFFFLLAASIQLSTTAAALFLYQKTDNRNETLFPCLLPFLIVSLMRRGLWWVMHTAVFPRGAHDSEPAQTFTYTFRDYDSHKHKTFVVCRWGFHSLIAFLFDRTPTGKQKTYSKGRNAEDPFIFRFPFFTYFCHDLYPWRNWRPSDQCSSSLVGFLACAIFL